MITEGLPKVFPFSNGLIHARYGLEPF
jgi:hypothetical protein